MNGLRCITCQREFSLNEPIWRCSCGGLLNIKFVAEFPIDIIQRRKPTLWRYREAIPIESDQHIISFDEGFTPLITIDFNGRLVLIKQDHLFATGSYKDRGASVLISKVKELGVNHVVEDSSGNAGCAIAAYCAKADITCDIFVPATTSTAKLAQIEMYGAYLHKIPGSREDTAAAVLQAAETNYYASHSWNPFFFQGTKTIAYEICEQLAWQAPDTIILPVGNGTLLLGVDIGFRDLFQAGVIETLPKLIAIQAEYCHPLALAFAQDQSQISSIIKKETLAEGIAIAKPIRGIEIMEAVRRSEGYFITVSETEIKTALYEMGRKGYYLEPTAAATIAGVKQYLCHQETEETIVSVFTGHGLKATQKIMDLL